MMSERWMRGLLLCALLLAVLTAVVMYRSIPRSGFPFRQITEKTFSLHLSARAVTVELNRQGKDWQVVTSSGPRPAQADRIESLLASLKGVQVQQVISVRPERAVDFEVTPASGTRVVLLDEKGKILMDAFIGKQAPDFSHLYFRYADRPHVYLSEGLFRGEIDPQTPISWVKVETSSVSAPSK